MNDQQRLYHDLAWAWPIISPPQGYVEETEQLCSIIQGHSRLEARTLLNLGCGGGHNDFTLKEHFDVTGVDTSEAMLKLARQLNPEVSYLAGDMRTVRLHTTFDVVTIFDSVNYMVTVQDLRSAFMTAFAHLRPGGVFLTVVEATPERFEQNWTQCSTHTGGDVEIAFIENSYDPDLTDTAYEVTFVYLIRRGGRLEVETDRHVCGIFALETWRGLLKEVGFEVSEMEFTYNVGGARTYPVFVCVKPPQRASGKGT